MSNTKREHRKVAKIALEVIKPKYEEADLELLMLALHVAFCNGKIAVLTEIQKK